MNSNFRSRVALAVLLVALTGCSASQGGMQQRGAPAGKEGMTGGSGMMGGAQGSGMMDMKSMCEMHAAMAGKSEEEKRSMMQAHAGNMSAQAMQKHMKMMESHCQQ